MQKGRQGKAPLKIRLEPKLYGPARRVSTLVPMPEAERAETKATTTPPTPPNAPEATGYGRVFAVREFRAVFAAHAFSLLGLVVSELALSVLVYDLTGSPLMSA